MNEEQNRLTSPNYEPLDFDVRENIAFLSTQLVLLVYYYFVEMSGIFVHVISL